MRRFQPPWPEKPVREPKADRVKRMKARMEREGTIGSRREFCTAALHSNSRSSSSSGTSRVRLSRSMRTR